MKPFTSWHIGGEAAQFYWPLHLQDLAQCVQQTPAATPITMIGLGSNILVSDEGIPGLVIITQGALKEITVLENGVIRAEAGLSCAQVARFAAKQNQVGGEFLAGIPGTVGGALLMNAGAFGGETWDRVVAVETLSRAGDIAYRSTSEFESGYRYTKGLKTDEYFVAAHFQFEDGDGKQSLEQIKTLLEKRAQTQPTGEPSCGSVFRNPKPYFAAQLIEACGLKGKGIGGAMISQKHANFIINTGDATAKDVLGLVQLIQDQVLEKHGIVLHPEFLRVGRFV